MLQKQKLNNSRRQLSPPKIRYKLYTMSHKTPSQRKKMRKLSLNKRYNHVNVFSILVQSCGKLHFFSCWPTNVMCQTNRLFQFFQNCTLCEKLHNKKERSKIIKIWLWTKIIFIISLFFQNVVEHTFTFQCRLWYKSYSLLDRNLNINIVLSSSNMTARKLLKRINQITIDFLCFCTWVMKNKMSTGN